MLEPFFHWQTKRSGRWINLSGLAVLFLGGALLWAYFFNGGKVPFDRHDWTQTGAYYSFMRSAVKSGQLPLHMGSTLVTTDRYLGRPDTLLSPQALLLLFLEPGPFMLANVLVMYSLGWVGLLLIRRRYRLALAPFTALFVLFNFNGHITAHFAVGHSEWVGYFILPFFVLLVLKLVEGDGTNLAPKAGWGWTLSMALVILGLMLQGAFHFVVWCLLFLGGLGLFYPRYAWALIKAGLAGGLLSLVRLLFPAVEFFKGGVGFVSGFPALTDLLTALTVIRTPLEAANMTYYKSLGWWEVDTYVGLAGLAFLLYFGIHRTWVKRNSTGGQGAAHLFAPLFLVVFLSIGQVYGLIARLPLPLVDSERDSTRFVIVPLVVLVVMASAQLQRFIDEGRWQGWRERLLVLGLLALMGHDLLEHTRFWRVERMAASDLFPSTPVDIRSLVTNHADPPYITALVVGLAVTLLTLIVLVVLAVKESGTQNRPTLTPKAQE